MFGRTSIRSSQRRLQRNRVLICASVLTRELGESVMTQPFHSLRASLADPPVAGYTFVSRTAHSPTATRLEAPFHLYSNGSRVFSQALN